MKVLYDYQAFTMQYFGGVSKCFCELISHFPKDVSVEIGVVQSNNVHLVQSGLYPILESVNFDYKTYPPQFKFWWASALNNLKQYIFTMQSKVIGKLKKLLR